MNELFNVKDKVVVITGGAGILGKGIAAYLAKEGAKVVVLDRSEEAGKALVESIKAEGNEAMFLYTDVMDKEVLEGNKVEIMKDYGRIDVLLNAAGGNMAGATIAPDKTFFDLQIDAFKKVVDDAIVATYKSGEINKIYNKWFQQPIPPKGLNLNFPMSDELKQLIAKPTDKSAEQM